MLLLRDPIEITESPYAAIGTGSCSPGNPRSAGTSSSITGIPAPATR
jgi:hypothetical protein